MKDNVREEVEIGKSLPEQDLRIPVKHALVDERTDLKKLCDEHKVSYNAASKAQSGHHEVANRGVQRLFQRLLHAWKPGSFAPAEGQEDQLVGDHLGSTEEDRPADYKDEAEESGTRSFADDADVEIE